jgi:hypothetical protein
MFTTCKVNEQHVLGLNEKTYVSSLGGEEVMKLVSSLWMVKSRAFGETRSDGGRKSEWRNCGDNCAIVC